MKVLTLITAVYNEEKTLERVVEKVQKTDMGKVSKELIIVNDGSTDNSKKIIEKLKKKYKNIKSFEHPKNMGKGAAMQTGLKIATGDIIAIQDADLEYDPKEIKRLIKPILDGKEQVVYGSRFLSKKENNRYLYLTYYFGNRILNLVTSILYGSKITDMETAIKTFKGDIIKNINLRARGFDMEPEITAKILKKGIKIKELPISYNPRTLEEGKKIRWRDGFIAICTLVYWRFKN